MPQINKRRQLPTIHGTRTTTIHRAPHHTTISQYDQNFQGIFIKLYQFHTSISVCGVCCIYEFTSYVHVCVLYRILSFLGTSERVRRRSRSQETRALPRRQERMKARVSTE